MKAEDIAPGQEAIDRHGRRWRRNEEGQLQHHWPPSTKGEWAWRSRIKDLDPWEPYYNERLADTVYGPFSRVTP